MSEPFQIEEDLEDLYENAPCGYLSLRMDGRIAKANQTFCRWTGYLPEQIIGERFQTFLKSSSRIFYETHFAPLLRLQGYFNEVALDLVCSNGAAFSALVNAAERKNADGVPIFIRVTIFDATDRRRYERELLNTLEGLKRQAAQLENRIEKSSADQARSATALASQREEAGLREQFIAVLGHDLRNPLASISAGTQIIQKSHLDERAEKVVLMMQKSVLRMSGLIDNVLDFARGRLGAGITIETASLQLEPILRHVVDELQSAHPETIISVDFSLNKAVTVDPVRIAQLFSNLLGNALTHGREGEPIKVTAKTGETFELSVSNSGNPISAAAMERLFHPFSRGEIRASQQGLGLGLYIVNEIAKAHGGTIEVTSSVEVTCFKLTMPLQPA